MIYNTFNQYIHDYFFKEENHGEAIILAVDDFIINDFCKKYDIEEEELKKCIRRKYSKSWDLSLTELIDIPQYIGFIAIQIYIASQMQNDGDFSAEQFNPRLEYYLNITKSKLQELYRSNQENLWHELKKWAASNNFYINIPDKKKGKGRFVQYPLSQALLNKEDLKNAPCLFEKVGLKLGERLDLDNFTHLVKDSDKYIFPTHYYRVKNRLTKENKVEMLYMQLFDFYNNEWDGVYPEEEEKKKEKNGSTFVVQKSRTFLVLDEKLKKLEVINHQNYLVNKYCLNNPLLFGLLNEEYNPYYPDIFLFSKDDGYNDWVDTRFLNAGEEHIIICRNSSDAKLTIHKLDSNYEDYSNQSFSIFKVRLSNEIPNHYYWDRFINRLRKKYKIEYGLKLSRNDWMLGAGPIINFTEETDLWINGKKQVVSKNNLSISCKDYPEGVYRLKVKDHPVERFNIKNPGLRYIDKAHGWQINRLEANWKANKCDYQVEGLYTCFPAQVEKASVRAWINVLMQQNNDKNRAVVINAIKRSKHGI